MVDEFSKALICEKRSPLIPAEHDLFGPLVGEWVFDYVDNHDTPQERHLKGEWLFAWVLGGTAVQDVFVCPSRRERGRQPVNDAEYSTTLRLYNPKTTYWDVFYGQPGSPSLIEARRDGNGILLVQSNSQIVQWRFSHITARSFQWQSLLCLPGARRQVLAEVYAQRRK